MNIKKIIENQVLDEYEQGIEDSIDEWEPIPNMEEEIKRYKSYFKAHVEKKQKISIRINANIINKIKEKAKENDIPYQTLISTILFQYVNGKIKVEL